MRETPVPPWRLFLGLWPSPATRAAIVEHAQAWHWPDAARRTLDERLHITLHFIGDVDADRVPALRDGLRCDWPGCTLELDRCEVWPGGIAVLEAGTVPPALAGLHACLGDALKRLDLPVETRRFRPHVTLARKAQNARPPASAALRWEAGPGYGLMRSVAGSYLPVHRFG
ncbi:RNA 2',3'-cyclic phosphodiesterase [Ramlibacter sp. XY19]|uniref:RNA 2',3'-cyclic phosphodiesterase n=1 Tax=Ramlibacter paludis TaxID=2908000 RepID=UPI0023D9CDE6|nr:RNA 2',3'-cyclic phosphodiesterase [Ramlibacter paludis]MCG2595073.1 RNA 2',3'-cyclic phosphodiesterase [Ramlibacter paludis]